MPNNVKHFAVHADDVERARKFYESVMGWQFTAWGPPGFFLIKTGTNENPGVHGALQGRREIVAGKPMFGFECTIGVDSIDETIADTEGNVVGAMQYEESYKD
jgi:predicted enzyme related to lactoylglutathione lyase